MSTNRIGRYEIQSEIGRGGMASVYLAYDPRFKRQVAIKLLPPQFLDNPILRRRFEREAQAIAKTEHPAIVPVYDFGEQDEQLYLVMRYMQGGSLYDRMRSGVMPLEQATTIIYRLSPALDAVHERGIVHRDLKPGNILFDSYGNAYLSDFGIAQLAEATTVLTGDAIIGTPAYMSPEQVRGQADLDGRSDIYALGAILFEMLCGRKPFSASTPMAVAMKHITEPVPSVRAMQPDLPAEIDDLLAKAMAKAPDERYAKAGELAESLKAAAIKTLPQTPPRSPLDTALPVEEISTVLETEIEDKSPVLSEHAATGIQATQDEAGVEPAVPVYPERQVAGSSQTLLSSADISRAKPWAWVMGSLVGLGGLIGFLVLVVIGGYYLYSALAPKEQPTPVRTEPPLESVDVSGGEPGSTPVAETGVFRDDFSDPSTGWPDGKDEDGEYGYMAGSFQIYVTQPHTLYWTTPDRTAANITVEVDAEKVSGADANYFGMICRLQDSDNYYYLVVSSDGFYNIGKYKNGEFFSLLPDGWEYSEFIHQGETTNSIRADCIDDQISLYANGTRLGQVKDTDFTSGEYGLMAASLDIGGTKILFDNFVAQVAE